MSIEELLKRPYYIMDILPMQVPAVGGGQYYKVEKYYLNDVERLSRQYADVLLKLRTQNRIVLFRWSRTVCRTSLRKRVFMSRWRKTRCCLRFSVTPPT